MKTCTVVHAQPERQWLWRVVLADSATVGEALDVARRNSADDDIPWDAPVGIFGALCGRDAVPRDGDRIELYRPLKADPKASRRARAKAAKQGPGPGASGPPLRSRS